MHAGTGSLLDDVADAEADYEQPDELMDWDGVPLEPFNLKAERERGYFDAEGNYLEFSNPEDNDAWLASLAGAERAAQSMLAVLPCLWGCSGHSSTWPR